MDRVDPADHAFPSSLMWTQILLGRPNPDRCLIYLMKSVKRAIWAFLAAWLICAYMSVKAVRPPASRAKVTGHFSVYCLKKAEFVVVESRSVPEIAGSIQWP